MALNQIERRLFIDSRKLIASGKTSRICFALVDAAVELTKTMPKSRHAEVSDSRCRLSIFIMGALNAGASSRKARYGLEDWLSTKVRRRVHTDTLRAARLAWIDWLLDEPWTDHDGGPQPLLPHEKVIIRKRNGEVTQPRPADSVRWYNATALPGLHSAEATQYDCVAYKVIYEAPSAA
jgi:hypothetical protein